jgi:hypothetical protein
MNNHNASAGVSSAHESTGSGASHNDTRAGGAQSAYNNTKFFDPASDATTRVAGRPSPKDFIPRGVDDNPSIITFLGRPVLLYQRTIDFSDTADSLLFQTPVMGCLYQVDSWVSKLQGISTITATVVFTIQVNSPATVGGMLSATIQWGHWPLPGQEIFASNTRIHYSQRQRVDLDFQDRQATIRVPYVSERNSYQLDKTPTSSDLRGEPGSFQLWLVSPANAPTSSATAPHVSVYAHLEDVVLGFPIDFTLAGGVPTLWLEQAVEVEFAPHINEHPVDSPAQVISQENNQRAVPEPAQTGSGNVQAEAKKFKFSSLLRTASSFAGKLAGFVPAVAEYALAGGVLLGGGAQLLEHFGWSRVEDNTSFMTTFDYPYRNNYAGSGVDYSATLGVDVDNAVVSVFNAEPNSHDPMALRLVAAMPAMVAQFTYADTDASGDRLAAINVAPASLNGITNTCLAYTGTSGDAGYITGPAGTVATFFQYWHGTMVYRFRAIGTKFHSGRLLIAHRGLRGLNTTSTLGGSMEKTNKTVWDVTESKIITVKVPMAANTHWLQTHASGFLYDFTNVEAFNGLLSVFVLNPLVHPDTVSSEIPIIVESWLEDARFASPNVSVAHYNSLEAFAGAGEKPAPIPRPPPPPTEEEEPRFYEQSGTVRAKGVWQTNVVGASMLGSYTARDHSYITKVTVGEDVESFKLLLAVPRTHVFVASGTTYEDYGAKFLYGGAADQLPFGTGYRASTFDAICLMYAWHSGSLRYQGDSFAGGDTSMSSWCAAIPMPNTGSQVTTTVDPPERSVTTFTNQILVRAPFYSPTHAEPNFGVTADTATTTWTASPAVSRFLVTTRTYITGAEIVRRSGGDDFHLMGWRGAFLLFPRPGY